MSKLKMHTQLRVSHVRTRTVYVRNEHVELWERAIQLAKDTDRALSDIIAEGLTLVMKRKGNVPKPPTPFPPNRELKG